MSNENPEYFLVMERRQLEAAAHAASSKHRQFQVLYALVKPKNKLSSKDKVQTAEAAAAEQYCVQDANEQLVKPKKLSKKGKTLRVEINDDHVFELLNFFDRDGSELLSPQFVSHRKSGNGHFEALDPSQDGVIEILPEDGPSWCAREDLVSAPVESVRYAADDLRATSQSVYAAQTATREVADDIAVAGLLPVLPSWLAIAGGTALALSGGGGGGASGSKVVDLVIQGRIMLGPVISGQDLKVVAYDANGQVLKTTDVVVNGVSTVNGTAIEYTMKIVGGYSGVVTVRLVNGNGNAADYISESSKTPVDLGTGNLYAVDTVAQGTTLKVINITQATDLAARQVLDISSLDADPFRLNIPKVGPVVSTSASAVDAINVKTSQILLNKSTPITQEVPTTTATTDSAGKVINVSTPSTYDKVLATLDEVTQRFLGQGTSLDTIQKNLSDKLQTDGSIADNPTTSTATPLFLTSLTTLTDGTVDDPTTYGINESQVDDRTIAHVYSNVKTSGTQVFKVSAISLLDKATVTNPIVYKIVADPNSDADGANTSYFSIDPATGQLSWNTNITSTTTPKDTHPGYFQVVVEASQDTGKKDSKGNAILSKVTQTVLVHVDSTLPNVDLNKNTPQVSYASPSFNAKTAAAGVQIAPEVQTPPDTDIAKITVVIGGADTANDKLVLNAAQALNANFSATGVTIGSGASAVASVNYSYDSAGKTLSITKNPGTAGVTATAFAPADVAKILAALKLQTASTTSGARTFSVSYTDLYGNTGTSATSTLTLDNTGPNADLNDVTTAGVIDTRQSVNASQASAGVAIAPQTQTPTDADIAKVSLVLGGAGLDTANDQIVLGTATLSGLTGNVAATTATLGGVAVTYTYDGNTKTLVITKTGGGVFTAQQVDDLVSAIQYKNAAPGATTQGVRTVTVSYTDAVDNTGSSATATLSVDTQGPNADLNDNTATGVVDNSQTVNASQASTGLAIAPKTQTPTDADIVQVSLALGGAGLDLANDQFVLGTATLSGINADAPATTASVGGVAVTFKYTAATKTLAITKTGGGVFTAQQVDDLVSAIQYKNAAPANTTQGDRVVTVSYTDAAGNTGSSATATLTVDTLGPNADLNPASPNVDTTQIFSNADATNGKSIALLTAASQPTENIATLTLVLGGATDSSDQLLLGTTPLALGTAVATGTPITIGTVSASYTYNPGTHTLVITRPGGAFTPAEVQSLLGDIKLKNTDPFNTPQTERTVTVSYVDTVGNPGAPAKATFQYSTKAPYADVNADTSTVDANLTVSGTTISAGVSIAPGIQAPSAGGTQVATISIQAGGGIDPDNDRLNLGGTFLTLGTTDVGLAPVTLGTVTVQYQYIGANKTLVITKADGSSYTPTEVQTVVQTIQLQTSSTAEATRTFTVRYTDTSGNVGNPATSTITVDTTGPNADLNDDTTTGVVDTSQTVNASQANTGVAIAPKTQTPTDTDIAKVSLVLGGAVLDIANDQFVLGNTTLSNLGTSVSSATATLGGVSVSYSYNASNKTLDITKTGGGTFTPKEVDDLVSAIQYKNTAPGTTTQGDRTVTVSYTDAVGNTGSTATAKLTVDTLAPNADLNFGNNPLDFATTFNGQKAANGVSIATGVPNSGATDAPDKDITTITLKLSGTLDAANDQLMLGNATLSKLGTAVSGATATLGGVSVTYSYDATSKTLGISKTGGGAFTSQEVSDLVSAIQFKTSSTTDGDRIVTVSYTDAAGNTGSSAQSTLTLDTTAPLVNLSVSKVTTPLDGSTALDAKHSDSVLELDEPNIVLKVDSVNPDTGTALHKGDQVTLQVWDDTTHGWLDLDQYTHNATGQAPLSGLYTQSVNFDDTTSGDGATTAIYFKVDRKDLAPNFAENKLRVHVTDAAGNETTTGTEVVVTVLGEVKLDSQVNAVDNLEVTSPIVITTSYGRPLSGGVAGKYIHISSTDGGHSFDIDASEARYVQLAGDKIIIKPPFDLDFGKHYQITIDEGAFNTQADPNKDIPSQSTKALGDPADPATGLLFGTVNIASSTDPDSAALGRKMNTTDGSVVNGRYWFSIDAAGTPSTLDLSKKDFAMVFVDKDPSAANPTVNDGAATAFDITVSNFGDGDYIYGDDKNNAITQLNSEVWTQIIESQPGGAVVHFDPLNKDPSTVGGTLRITGDGTVTLDTTNLQKQIRITNANGVTPIDAFKLVDAAGVVIPDTPGFSGARVESSITDTNPLHVKVTAAVHAGDVIRLKYIDSAGAMQDLVSAYAVNGTDVTNGYVKLDITRTQLNKLPQQEGSNKIFAELTDGQTGALSYSTLLGGDSGLWLDTYLPTPTLTVQAGEDTIITSDPTDQVHLVVKAANLEVGETLTLKDANGKILATYTVDTTNFGTDAVLNTTPFNKDNLTVGDNVFTVTASDKTGNTQTSSITIVRKAYVAYSGTVGLGPVEAGNDLLVTAYDQDGKLLNTAKVVSVKPTDVNQAGVGTFSIDIDASYSGAVTLRVTNATSSTATPDYRDESTNTARDIGTGSLAAVVEAKKGVPQSVNITALTDLAARQLTGADNKLLTGISLAQITAYNKALAKILGLDVLAPDTQITEIQPSFVVTESSPGTFTFTAAGGKYGQLLAQISDQQNFGHLSLDATQSTLASGITWAWNSGTSTATATVSGDMARQVLLLTKVAQAAALGNGYLATPYLSDTDLSSYGITGVSGLSATRKSDLLQRIVNSKDDGSDYDTISELQVLASKVVALAKIQDYAANSAAAIASNQVPTTGDYDAAGITGVTDSNLTTVNSRMAGYSTVINGKPAEDYKIQTAVNTWVNEALTVIRDYAVHGSEVPLTVPVPSATHYAMVGIVGVTAANLAAVNAKVDADASLGASSSAADVQASVSAAVSSYSAAIDLLRAYIRDPGANPAPDTTTFAALGMAKIDTADEVVSAKYYLSQVMTPSSADGTDKAILDALNAQYDALLAINKYAQDNNSLGGLAPKLSQYLAAGIPATIATSTNYTQLNTTVDGETSIPNALVLLSKLTAAVGALAVPTLSSIVCAGSSVVNGTFQNDAYLNAAELGAGASAKFTVTFDRAVTGLTATHFGLTDSYGNAMAGAVPVLSLTTADGGAGRLWTVSVSGLSGLTSNSLRLNLVNSSGVKDAVTGTSLTNASFNSGQSYTVDTVNSPTLQPATGQDLTLTSSEPSVDLYVDPANLTVGDVLKLTLGGTQIVGTDTVTVTATHLTTGVTFKVLKTALPTASNVITLTSTDVAGNIGTASVTVSKTDYITLSGSLGLPSQVLGSSDLQIAAYDTDGKVIGTGTVNTATNTYSLQLAKSGTDGYVKLQLTNAGTGPDYTDKASSAAADLGSKVSTPLSAVIYAGSADKANAHIGLLTDVAARLILASGLTSATDITQANTAVARLLLGSSAASDITTLTPDFATSATLYGQWVSQLAQQAFSKGRALDVVVKDLAAGIDYNSTMGEATLNSAFAKEVAMLAKTQLAAATGNVGTLSVQDLIDGGVTGLSALTSAHQSDLLQRIAGSGTNSNAVDTLAEVQALTDQVHALGVIQDYAEMGATPPTLADYNAAGIPGVTEDNLAAVNAMMAGSDAAGTSTRAAIQTLADTGKLAHIAALATIAAYAEDSTKTVPDARDYALAGISGVTGFSVVAVNAQIAAKTAANVPDRASIQNLADVGLILHDDAVGVLQAYAKDSASNTAPNLADYKTANLAPITTEDQVANANFLLSGSLKGQSWTETSLDGKLEAQIATLQTLSTYATGGAPPASETVYQDAGFSTATASNLADLNARMALGTSITRTTQVVQALKALDIDVHSTGLATSSYFVDDASTAATAHALFADIAPTYADGIATIKLAITGADAYNDQLLLGDMVKAINATTSTGAGLALAGISGGLSWSYSNSAHQFAFTKDDGSSFSASEAQTLEQALQFKSSLTAAQGERGFSLTHLYADGSSTAAVTAKVWLDTAPHPHSASFGAASGQITLDFDGVLSGTPQATDFSNIQVGGASATLGSVSTSGNSLLLSLASTYTDSVVSLDYTPNAYTANRLTAAGSGVALGDFSLFLDASGNDNASLTGNANKHNVIVGNGGQDSMTGGNLADVFVFGAGTSGTSTITNFSLSQFDKLDLSGLLSGYTAGQQARYLQLNTVGADLRIQIDKDGLGDFVAGVDATVVLTGNGHSTASTSTDLLNYFIKTNAFVL